MNNPNSVSLKNVNVAYETAVDGEHFSWGKDIPIDLKSVGESTWVVAVRIKYNDYMRITRKTLMR